MIVRQAMAPLDNPHLLQLPSGILMAALHRHVTSPVKALIPLPSLPSGILIAAIAASLHL